MSYFNPMNTIIKTEKVDFIVPERLREARSYNEIDREFAAEQLGIPDRLLGLYENGHKEIPKELLMGLEKLYKFPKGYFYKVKWKRV